MCVVFAPDDRYFPRIRKTGLKPPTKYIETVECNKSGLWESFAS